MRRTNAKAAAKAEKAIATKGVVWDVNELLEGQSFDSIIKSLNAKTEAFKQYRKILNNNLSPEEFLEILKSQEDIHVLVVRVDAYASLRIYENSEDSDALAKFSQLKQILTSVSNDIMFFNLWFIQIENSMADKFFNAKILEKYKYHLEEIRRLKPYTKSEEIERLLNIKDTNGLGAFSELYETLTSSFVYKLDGKQVSEEEIRNEIKSPNPQKRKKAYDLLFEKYSGQYTLISEIYKDVVTEWHGDGIQIRGYKSPINIRNVSNDISDRAVEVLLNSVKKNSGIFSEYFKLKYKINIKNGPKYPYSKYHLYAPFPLKLTKKYDYETSKKMVLEVFKEFDDRFYANALKILNSKHIHSHPKKGKRSGAFCMNISNKTIPYMMLNHTDHINDVFAMIHETGHVVHAIFSEKCTNFTYSAALPICETASVFSEMLLAKKLLRETKNDAEKQYILMHLLDEQFASILVQSYYTIFEKFAHEKIIEGVNTQVLDQGWYDTLKEQFGDMDIPEKFKKGWLHVTHIFRYPFYCYAYVWGNLFVLSLYDMYKKEGKKFIDKYIELLGAGGSDSPANLMKKLGVDPEDEQFWQRGFNIIKEEIEELKKLAK